MLAYAEKYNWWTPADQKSSISLETKIEYLLERGSLEEIKQSIQELGGKKIFEVWQNRIQKKQRILKGRHKVIEYLVTYHQNYLIKK